MSTSLLHCPRVLLSRYRRWMNKVSNLKIHRWFCSHCLVTWLLRLRYITGRSGKQFVVQHKQSGPGGSLLPLGGPGCKSAGPCHLYYEVTRRPHYGADATMAVPCLKQLLHLVLRKVTGRAGANLSSALGKIHF